MKAESNPSGKNVLFCDHSFVGVSEGGRLFTATLLDSSSGVGFSLSAGLSWAPLLDGADRRVCKASNPSRRPTRGRLHPSSSAAHLPPARLPVLSLLAELGPAGSRFRYEKSGFRETGISGVHEKYPIDSKVVGRDGYATGVRKAGNANLSLRDGR
ncbi:hypothetical protein B296_00056803 [Ensete ventricosum]|uniref:Uncharacterized protein n=1 Tax=Ensete ventricosum TaxID=4639 RepID=A0A426XDX7_ENSVE|nr:hypothetical protein B296_00056803 [Ensete ventricosum]